MKERFGGEGQTILRMKQELMADIQLMDITEENKLPKGCNKTKSKSKSKELGELSIVEEGIYELVKVIRRRDQFDEEFNININERMNYNNETEGMIRVKLLLVPYHS